MAAAGPPHRSDSFHRGPAAGKSFRRSGTRILRRRNDRAAHHRSWANQCPASDFADFRDALQGHQKNVTRNRAGAGRRWVVEGSVERAGDQVRITAQLIEAPTDRHLWAKSYERDLRDVLSLQDEVAQAIAGEVRIKLTPQERIQLTSARPVNPQAHEAYLRGYYELRKHKPASMYVAGEKESIKKAIEYFQQALTIDPNDALAYAGLADAYYDQSTFLRAPLEVMPKAKAAAVRAIELV